MPWFGLKYPFGNQINICKCPQVSLKNTWFSCHKNSSWWSAVPLKKTALAATKTHGNLSTESKCWQPCWFLLLSSPVHCTPVPRYLNEPHQCYLVKSPYIPGSCVLSPVLPTLLRCHHMFSFLLFVKHNPACCLSLTSVRLLFCQTLFVSFVPSSSNLTPADHK